MRSSRSPARSPLAPKNSKITPKPREPCDPSSGPLDFKQCSACREAKPLVAFAKNRARRDGFDNACRACVKIRKATAYQRKKAQTKSERRPIAGNRVIDVGSLKIIKALSEALPHDYDQRFQSALNMLVKGGAA